MTHPIARLLACWRRYHTGTKMDVPVFWDIMLASLRVAERISPLGNAAAAPRASKL